MYKDLETMTTELVHRLIAENPKATEAELLAMCHAEFKNDPALMEKAVGIICEEEIDKQIRRTAN